MRLFEMTQEYQSKNLGFQVSIDDVIDATCKFYSVPRKDLLSRSMSQSICLARQVFFHVAISETKMSGRQVAHAFGRDHTTVYHARKRVKSNKSLQSDVQSIRVLSMQTRDRRQEGSPSIETDKIAADHFIDAVCEYYSIDRSSFVTGGNGVPSIVVARQICCVCLRQSTKMSLVQISRSLGMKSHSSAVKAIKVIGSRDGLKSEIDDICAIAISKCCPPSDRSQSAVSCNDRNL